MAEAVGLLPHGYCFLWEPGLLWLHVVSDSLTVLAYFSLPFALLYFVKRRRDLPFSWILLLFGAFILLCGTAHLLAVWNVWHPDYWLTGWIKAAMASVSITTAVLVWPTLPKLLALPSQTQLLRANDDLAAAVDRHRAAVETLRKFSKALECSSSMVVITDASGRIEYCNPAYSKVTGYDASEVLGQHVGILISSEAERDGLTPCSDWEVERLEKKKCGDAYWCSEYVAPIRDAQGQVTNFVVVSHDITRSKESDRTIRQLAFFDSLTALPNRVFFWDRLDSAIRSARQSPTSFAVMYLDLDRFKNINDTLGHVVGDKLLVAVGDRLQKVLRKQDTVARLGGDEFAILLPSVESRGDLEKIATSIVAAMRQPFEINDYSLLVTVSIGISIFPTDHTERDELIKMADTALYSAKDRGRNAFDFYRDAPGLGGIERLQLESALAVAQERGEFAVHYQPKFSVASGKLVGAEALLRWKHNELGWIPPNIFIPIAEETGLIGAIGGWVLTEVCRQIGNWAASGFRVPVAVNLSARQFRDGSLIATIERALETHGADPACLEMEITESTVMANPEAATDTLKALKSRGLELSIDDFGTGYSSLSYLKRFPVDALKIDRSFVRDITTDADDAAIVGAVIALAHSLGVKVIAEGVETREQLEYLRVRDCDEVQGYLFSEPLPLKEFETRWLEPTKGQESVSPRGNAECAA